MNCDDVRMSLGAYVLGALEPEECVVVEAHLAECDGCRAEFDELTGVAGFLGKVSEEDVAQVASPPRAVLDRLLGARARKRRIARVMLSLAASVLVVGLGGTMWAATRSPESTLDSAALPAPAAASAGSEGGFAAPQQRKDEHFAASASPVSPESDDRILSAAPDESRTVKAGKGAVRAAVTMTRGDGTTAVKVVLSGAAMGTPFRLDVISAGGERQTAGNWVVNKAAYDRSGPFLGSTTIPFGSISRFEVVTAENRVLVDVRVP
ncbi:anti-sigma factor family protein [Streptosporangium carneum]